MVFYHVSRKLKLLSTAQCPSPMVSQHFLIFNNKDLYVKVYMQARTAGTKRDNEVPVGIYIGLLCRDSVEMKTGRVLTSLFSHLDQHSDRT